MLLDAAMVALIVGAFAGGRLRGLKDFDLRAPGVFILAALVKVGLAILGWRGASFAVQFGGAINIFSYLLLLVGLWLNRHLWGMRIAAVGVLLNFLVIAANGGSMPVDRDLAVQAGSTALVAALDSPAYVIHKPLTPATRLRPLADVLKLPLFIQALVTPGQRFFAPSSIGDVIVTLGACWLILSGLGAFGLGGRRQPAEDAPNGGDATT